MLSTFLLAGSFFGVLIASVFLWALFLRLGLRWAKVPDVTRRRVVFATMIVFILQFAMQILFLAITPANDAQAIILGVVQIVAAIITPCVVIGALFNVKFLRAIQAWLPTLLTSIATFAFAFLVWKPFLYEGFVVPTNAMAPTLVGQHWKAMCPECGKPSYCSPMDEQYRTADPPLMICEQFHVTTTSEFSKNVHTGDYFLVTKFLSPQRWDLVVFQNPEQPTTLYVKRLVGLPGEKVHIQDGSVWIDDVRQFPPDSMSGIEYLSELPDWYGPAPWGTENRPALLGDDEYFVLGDFSASSLDSRFWNQGAPGHNPFAVPRSHIKGVVTHTYWPPKRWRIHR